MIDILADAIAGAAAGIPGKTGWIATGIIVVVCAFIVGGIFLVRWLVGF